MPSQNFLLTCRIAAPPEQVFDFFADHESFGRIWSGRTLRIRKGRDAPNGLGSTRRVTVGPLSFEETTITYERPRLLEYTATRGSPVRNHLGHIEVHPDGDGSRIHYTIGFDPLVPFTGGIMARLIRRDWGRNIGPLTKEIESF